MQKKESEQRAKHRSNASAKGTHRGLPEEWGVDSDEWAENLVYYPHEADSEASKKHCFYSSSDPTYIAESIFKFCKKADEESDIEMDDKKWKLSFTVKGDEEEMLDDANVEVTFQEAKESTTGDKIPDEVFVQFRRQKGNAITFGNFMKDMMAQEGGVNIWMKDE